MDISQEYIEMCSQATEIQIKYEEGFDNGDIAFDCANKIGRWNPFIVMSNQSISDEDGGPKSFITITKHIWLPRQDQLQEICLNAYLDTDIEFRSSPTVLLGLMSHWVFKSGILVTKKTSLEQLWLMYTMEELYAKRWNYDLKAWTKHRG